MLSIQTFVVALTLFSVAFQSVERAHFYKIKSSGIPFSKGSNKKI